MIIDIHAVTERYLADHPDARDLLTRKKQHAAQYAMRIALANSTFWQRTASTETAESTPELDHAQKKVDDAVLKEDARKKVAAEKEEKKTPYKIRQEEQKRYEGVQSVYEIKQRADADKYLRFAWRKTLKDAEDDVKRLEKAVKELEAKPSPTPDDVEKITDLRKKRSTAVSSVMEARIHYTAKTEAIEIATRRVYETHPPVITKEFVDLAKEIIDIAEKSSLAQLIENIPADKWYEAKEEAIRILTKAGKDGLPSSILEKKLKKYNFGDKYALLIKELEDEGRIEVGPRNPNGGFRVYIPATEDELSSFPF